MNRMSKSRACVPSKGCTSRIVSKSVQHLSLNMNIQALFTALPQQNFAFTGIYHNMGMKEASQQDLAKFIPIFDNLKV